MTYNDLKEAVKKLNDLKLEGLDKLKTVGLRKEVLLENFLRSVEKVDDLGKTEELPEEIIEAYNWFSKNEMEESESAKKASPAKKKSIKKSRYGHVQSAVSGKLDDMLFEGATVADMMQALELKRTRVIGHINHLKNDKGLTFIEEKPEDGKLNDTFYRCKEETA